MEVRRGIWAGGDGVCVGAVCMVNNLCSSVDRAMKFCVRVDYSCIRPSLYFWGILLKIERMPRSALRKALPHPSTFNAKLAQAWIATRRLSEPGGSQAS